MNHRIWLRDFQSFDKDGAGLSNVSRINVIVGPNNAGKSKILRAADRAARQHKDSLIAEAGGSYVVEYTRELSDDELGALFPQGQYGGDIPVRDEWSQFGASARGTMVYLRVDPSADTKLLEVFPVFTGDNVPLATAHNLIVNRVKRSFRPPWRPLLSSPIYHISAERDVKPESLDFRKEISSDGTGVTSLIQQTLLDESRSAEPVERWLLNDLNRIMYPDHRFSRILTRHSGNTWQVFLDEEGKGLVPLSQCGSGLKTVLHLLAYANLKAARTKGKITQGTFLLEELENCLHPHVQRNLFAFLDETLELPARAFLTTHSSVCLDYFQGHKDVQLTHVYQEAGKTRSRPVEAFEDRCGVLDRMGSRASEALQSNAVIWVEGPSDRTYLKHWFELCGADIVEGRDYSIMFYGGDLLAHLTMNSDEEFEEYIRLLRINRNSAILIDSDKTHRAEPIRETKRRVKEEAERQKRIAWITKGKEIENYLAPSFLQRMFSPSPTISNYEPPWTKLKGLTPLGATRSLQTKVEFAEFVRKTARQDDFQLDWRDRTREVIAFVLSANGRTV